LKSYGATKANGYTDKNGLKLRAIRADFPMPVSDLIALIALAWYYHKKRPMDTPLLGLPEES
jgi:hypothetical protein